MPLPGILLSRQYRKDQEGNDRTYMLYGHVHNSFDEVLVSRFIRETKEARRVNMYTRTEEPIPCNMLNCFCMYSDYELCPWMSGLC